MEELCEWVLERRLQASNKREAAGFGTSLAVDDTEGVLVVGAHGQRERRRGIARAGAVYLFKRRPIEMGSPTVVNFPPFWNTTEVAHFAAVDPQRGQALGWSVAIATGRGFALAGAPGDSLAATRSGAAVAFDVKWSRAHGVGEWPRAREGFTSQVNLAVVRPYGSRQDMIALSFATSDGTAVGVTADRGALCDALATEARDVSFCGDYTHTEGVLTFSDAEAKRKRFVVVPITDNTCRKAGQEAFVVQVRPLPAARWSSCLTRSTLPPQLGIPGGPMLEGEMYRVVGRIDDNGAQRVPAPSRRLPMGVAPVRLTLARPDVLGEECAPV